MNILKSNKIQYANALKSQTKVNQQKSFLVDIVNVFIPFETMLHPNPFGIQYVIILKTIFNIILCSNVTMHKVVALFKAHSIQSQISSISLLLYLLTAIWPLIS